MNKNGFSLIELLVAVAIMGVLSTLIMTNMQGARERARDVQRKSDLHQIKTALRLYYNDHQNYPVNDGTQIVGCGNAGDETCEWGSDLFGSSSITYMKKLPADPMNSTATPIPYYYTQDGDDDFSLTACIENASDPDKDLSTNGNCSIASYTVTTD